MRGGMKQREVLFIGRYILVSNERRYQNEKNVGEVPEAFN